MKRSLAWILLLGGSTCLADSPSGEVAARAWAIADTVLARHVDPPTRQQMLLAGIKAIVDENRLGSIDHLPRRVSDLANAEQLAKLLDEVGTRSNFKDPTILEEAFFQGMLGVVSGDPSLLSSKERQVTESMEANLYVGIQVALGFDEETNKPVFQQILEGGPAANAGIMPGDRIDEIDGVSTLGMTLAQVVDRLRGAEGTEVRLKYSRASKTEPLTATLTRGRLPQATIEGYAKLPQKRWKVLIDDGSPIGYLKLKEISGSTPRELRTFAEQLEAEGAKALILDLREVRRAGFHPTVLLADALLDGGVIGRVASSDGERTIQAEPDTLFRGWPIVVLANPIVIGEVAWLGQALDANHRAKVLGSTFIQDEPMVAEIVSVPGTDWSIRMSTGRLIKGDGKALRSIQPELAKNHSVNNLSESLKLLSPKPSERLRDIPNVEQARSLLEAALKGLAK
jgi:carboxyl-terminal processing protease